MRLKAFTELVCQHLLRSVIRRVVAFLGNVDGLPHMVGLGELNQPAYSVWIHVQHSVPPAVRFLSSFLGFLVSLLAVSTATEEQNGRGDNAGRWLATERVSADGLVQVELVEARHSLQARDIQQLQMCVARPEQPFLPKFLECPAYMYST